MSGEKLSQSEPTKEVESATAEEPPKQSLTGKKPSKQSLTAKKPSKQSLTGKKPSKQSLAEKKPSKQSLTAKKPSKQSLTAKKPSKQSLTEKKPSKQSLTGKKPSKQSETPSINKDDLSKLSKSEAPQNQTENPPDASEELEEGESAKVTPPNGVSDKDEMDPSKSAQHHHHHHHSTGTETEHHKHHKHSKKLSDKPGHHHRRHSKQEDEELEDEEEEEDVEEEAEEEEWDGEGEGPENKDEGSFDMAAFKRQMSVTWQKNHLPSFQDPYKGDSHGDIQSMFGIAVPRKSDDLTKMSRSIEPVKQGRLPKEWLVNCKNEEGKVVKAVYTVELSPQVSLDAVNDDGRPCEKHKIPPYTRSDANQHWGIKDSIRAIRGSTAQTAVSAVPSVRSLTSRYTRESRLSATPSSRAGLSNGFDPNQLAIWVPGRHIDHASDPNKRHFIKIVNTLNYDIKILESTQSTLLKDVRECYRFYNPNIDNYRWTDIYEKPLDFEMTLHDNGLVDNSYITDEIGLDYFPMIFLFFMDGYENDPPMQLDIRKAFIRDADILCRNYQLGLAEYVPEDYEGEGGSQSGDLASRRLLIFDASRFAKSKKTGKGGLGFEDGDEEDEDAFKNEMEEDGAEEDEGEEEEEEEEEEDEEETPSSPIKECRPRRLS